MISRVKDQKTVNRCFCFTVLVETFHFFPSYSAFSSDKHWLIKCEDKLQFRQPIAKDKHFRGMLERQHHLIPTLLLQRQYLTLPIRINEKEKRRIWSRFALIDRKNSCRICKMAARTKSRHISSVLCPKKTQYYQN